MHLPLRGSRADKYHLQTSTRKTTGQSTLDAVAPSPFGLMGRSPCCCHEAGVKKGPWTEEEDRALVEHMQRHGGRVGSSWRGLPKAAGLNRCGKSCRLRWTNYLRPDIRRGNFTDHEERLIISLHAVLGNKWSTIATHLDARTDNEIKNYWNTHVRKKLLSMGVDPVTHQQLAPDHLAAAAAPAVLPDAILWAAASAASLGGLDSDLRQVRLLQRLLQAIVGSSNNDGAIAMFNPTATTGVIPNLQQHQLMNTTQSPAANYQLPGYLRHTDAVQQPINAAAPAVAAAAPTADQYCGSATAAFPHGGCRHGAAAEADRPAAAAVQEFIPGLDSMELPNLCSLESDSFWKDMLNESYLL